jgi:hypothetical protein
MRKCSLTLHRGHKHETLAASELRSATGAQQVVPAPGRNDPVHTVPENEPYNPVTAGAATNGLMPNRG